MTIMSDVGSCSIRSVRVRSWFGMGHIQLVDSAIAKDHLEPGVGCWNVPYFPVPKEKKQGNAVEYKIFGFYTKPQ